MRRFLFAIGLLCTFVGSAGAAPVLNQDGTTSEQVTPYINGLPLGIGEGKLALPVSCPDGTTSCFAGAAATAAAKYVPTAPSVSSIAAAGTWQTLFVAGSQSTGGHFQNTSSDVEYICFTGCSGTALGASALAVYPASATNMGIMTWGPISTAIMVYGGTKGQTFSADGG
ncbi:MAG: hypothetical protein ABF876_05190 [Acetobacter aceti]